MYTHTHKIVIKMRAGQIVTLDTQKKSDPNLNEWMCVQVSYLLSVIIFSYIYAVVAASSNVRCVHIAVCIRLLFIYVRGMSVSVHIHVLFFFCSFFASLSTDRECVLEWRERYYYSNEHTSVSL